MKTGLFALLIIVGAFVSVILSELLMTVVWLPNAPFAVTGNYFWGGLVPVEFVVVGIASLALLKVFHHRQTVFTVLYVVLFCSFHAAELSQFFNPWEDILRYVAAILLSSIIWFGLLRNQIWRTG